MNLPEETARNIRALLEKIYDSSMLWTFDDLVEAYAGCFSFPFRLMFYIKEQPRFGATDGRDAFLKFHYLSFHSVDGRVTRFRSLADLEQREAELLREGCSRHVEPLCVILFKADSDAELAPIINLTKRLFVAFYKNCGSRDHFLENVAQRFIKEFYRQNAPELASLKAYIERVFSLNVVVSRQRDEMYYVYAKRPSEVLALEPGVLSVRLEDDSRFFSDVLTSARRKNQTFGKTRDGAEFYVVNTLREEYFLFAEDEFREHYKTRQKWCIVYSSTTSIDLDEVFFSNRLIENFLRWQEEIDREKVLLEGDSNLLGAEETLSERPLALRSKFDGFVASIVADILRSAVEITAADGAAVYLTAPRYGGLRLFSHYSQKPFDHDPAAVWQAKGTAYERVLDTDREYDLWHPKKLDDELKQANERGEPKKQQDFQRYIEDSRSMEPFPGPIARSSFILPLRKGNLQIGIIEFFAEEVSRLSPDIPVFRLIARRVGDAMRRLELANDRGWLSQMTYVHASRHRVEAIHREISTLNKELANRFNSLWQQSQEAVDWGHGPETSSIELAIARIHRAAIERVSHSDADKLRDQLDTVLDVSRIPRHCAVALFDIFDTLLSNSRYTKFQVADLTMFVRSREHSYDFLEIRYTPSEGKTTLAFADQICHAPIPDNVTPTYHYGLFLCAAQLRMIGGAAQFFGAEDAGFNNTQFGVVFYLPLEGGSDGEIA